MINKNLPLVIGNNSDEDTLNNIYEHLSSHYKITPKIFKIKEFFNSTQTGLVLLFLSDEEIKSFFKNSMKSELKIGIVPNKLCTTTMRSYGISSDIFEAIDDLFNKDRARHVDILTCNDEIVFNNIVIGNVHGLNKSSNTSTFSKIKNCFSNLSHISFRDYKLTTSKNQIVETAATGIMVLEHSIYGISKNLLNEDLSFHDGKLNALVLAPSSIVSYIYYSIMTFFYDRFSINKLPKSIGMISTSSLEISSSKPMDFYIDGVGISSKLINLEVIKDAQLIQLGRLINDTYLVDEDVKEEEKDVIKVASLPKGDMRKLLLEEPIPIFKKAEEEDFKELFVGLKNSASLSMPYIVLMVLSTLLATTGLFQNSTPVIIGAMILAPLMSPIISLSMGVARGDQFLLKASGYTLIIGIVTALIFSSIYTFLMPLHTLTSEMSARLNPNILDLMVAVISGVAGAYANSKSEIAKSLAGVAIAVALVPPLSVTGIGIGFGNIEVIYGSFLLFITNLIGITLAATVTFLILGYAPIHRAKKGIVYTTSFLVLVTIPLLFSFMLLIKQNNITEKLQALKTVTIENKEMRIDVLSVDLSQKKPNIHIEVYSDDMLEKNQALQIKLKIQSVMKTPVTLNITPKIIL